VTANPNYAMMQPYVAPFEVDMGKKPRQYEFDNLVAVFWKNGRFQRFTCIDCQIMVQPNYSEIILRDSMNNSALFIISNDPDIAGNMLLDPNVHPGVFDGFQLRDFNGTVIEKISIFDNTTLQ